MRVLIVTHYLGEAFPHGVERAVMHLSTELAGAGVDVAIATTLEERPADGFGAWPRRSINGLPVFPISAGPLDAIGLPAEERSAEAIDRVLDAWEPDIVHVTLVHGLHPNVVVHAKRRGVAVLLDCHSYEVGCARLLLEKTNGEPCPGPDEGRECAKTCFADLPGALGIVTDRLETMRAALLAADAVTACSSHVARWIARTCGVPEPQVISPPIAPPESQLPVALQRSPASRGQLNLAMIGTVGRTKGADFVVEAVASVALGPTELLLLGAVLDPEFKSSLVKRAAAVPDLRLRLTGPFDPSQLPVLLSDVDALVVATRSPETYSLAAREAWSRGIPVLASRLGALPDAVDDGRNGFLFDHDAPEELAAALTRLVTEPELLANLRDGALRTPFMTPSAHRSAIEQVYARIAPGSGDVDRSSGAPGKRADSPAETIESAPTARFQATGWQAGDSRHASVFSDIYQSEYWRLGGESSSGPGSRREWTRGLQRELPKLLARLGVSTVLDLGCGDFNWMREVELGAVLYTGADVVFDVVLENRLRHGGPRRRFLYRDLTRDPLPRADLVLCRDVLIHFPDEDLIPAMQAIVDSGARYLLAGTFLARTENPPIVLGDWRPLNMQLPPLSMPPPADWLVETVSEPGFEDKRLALWDLHALR
jgi:glycosyltransferase involved in cell wall biosynthesis/SAM-dependent methyltransferase